jgi:hypothetical protein
MIETMSQKESVTLGVSNEGEKNFPVDVIKNWTPEKVNYFGNTVYFKVGEKFYSINSEDFKDIFSN